jgi:ABC-type glycerol-3-phosphate transport system substrate-binding protein
MTTRDRVLIDRRSLLKSGAGAAAALTLGPVLVACGDDDDARNGGGKVSGTIEAWDSDPRERAIAAADWWGTAFAAATPGVTVKTVTVPYGDDSTRLRATSRGGVAPDVLWAYGDNVTSYGSEGLVIEVTDLVDSIGRDRFLGAAIESIDLEGKVYTVPVVGFPEIVYYRKDLYEKAGLEVPTTHEQLLENIEALHDPPDMYGYMLFNGQPYETFQLKSVMWTHGAYYFDADDNLALDRPETIAAWNYFKQLGEYTPPGSMAQSDLESRELMKDGKVAHGLSTTSFAGDLPDKSLDLFGSFPMPVKEGAKGATLDFVGFSVPKQADNQDGGRAMIEFLFQPKNFDQYLSRTITGWIPMLEEAYTEKYFSIPANAKRREFFEVGRDAAKDGVVGIGYFGPSEHTPVMVKTGVEKAIGDRLVLEGQSPEEVMEFAVEQIESEL